MSKNTIADLSVTPSNNTDLLAQASTGAADANTIDTIIQNLTGILARAYGDQGGLGTVGGSANAIILTSLSTYQQYQAGLQVAFKASAANTAAATLNLDGLGIKKIRRKGDTALSAGDIAANGRYLLQYDAAYDTAAGAWVLMNPEGYMSGGTDVAVADGGTGLSSYAVGDTLYASAAAVLSKLPAGTAAQNYEMNAGATAPQWGAPVGRKFLASGSVAAAATLDVVLTAYTAYRGIVIELINLIPATNGADLQMRMSTNGGSSYDSGATDYKYTVMQSVSDLDTVVGSIRSQGSSSMKASVDNVGNGSNEGVSTTVRLMGQTNAAIKPTMLFDSVAYRDNDSVGRASGAGVRNAAQDTDAVRFFFTSGNITSGTYAVYGYV